MYIAKKDEHGFSLLELIIVLAIVAIISLLIAYQPQNLIQQAATHTAGHSIASVLRLARNLAISTSSHAVICVSEDGKNCLRGWNGQWVVFADTNANAKRDAKETIAFQRNHQRVHITYSRNVSSLRFDASGRINNNGTFSICPTDNNSSLAQVIIISRQGRLRYGVDSNGDGIVENSQSKNVQC